MGKRHNPAFLQLVEAARATIRECSPAELQQRLQAEPGGFQLLDVREDHEYTRDHLPQARHLSKGIIERDIETLFPDRATPMVLYCGGGYRSALAAQSLQAMGYRHVQSLWGGIRAWRASDLPLEEGS